MTTNRIPPETLPALYRKHGLSPVRDGYYAPALAYGPPRCACGIGISLYDRCGGTFSDTWRYDMLSDLEISPMYHDGYGDGFAGEPYDADYLGDHLRQADYDLGYADGAAGWAAVKDLAVTR